MASSVIQRRAAPAIKTIAASHGVTQRRFARDARLTYNDVHRIFNGEAAAGSKFIEIAVAYFGLPADVLFHDETSPLPGKPKARR